MNAAKTNLPMVCLLGGKIFSVIRGLNLSLILRDWPVQSCAYYFFCS